MTTLSLGQIEFLNSVIVDLQKKNEDLKGKLEKMAEAALNGNNASEMDNYGSANSHALKQMKNTELYCCIRPLNRCLYHTIPYHLVSPVYFALHHFSCHSYILTLSLYFNYPSPLQF